MSSLWQTLPLDVQSRVDASDPVEAATALLEWVSRIPPLSSSISARSAWLARATEKLQQMESPPPHLELLLLSEVAVSMGAARQSAACLATLEQAASLGQQLGQWGGALRCMSRSVIEHCVVADGAALVSLRRLEESVQAHPEALREPVTVADLNLARAAVAASVKSWDLTKQALADMGRAGLPKDERLHFYALAAHEVLAQVSMRGGQRAEAFRLLTEASSIAKDLEAWAEYANHQAILAAYGVRMGSFDSALLHAQDTMTAVQRSGVTHARVSPWLGVGFDLAVERDFAGVVRALAEAVNTNLKIGDRYGYLVAACAMVAMYLAADRAAEGLDALNEAISAVDEQADPSGAAILREVSEKLLRFIGLLQ